MATSIFDWEGPEFLAFYAAAFVVAVIWSNLRRKKALAPFEPPPGSTPLLEDPIEIAFLAGGAPRSAQVAVVNLVKKGALSWQPATTLRKGRLKQTGPLPPDAHWFERSIYTTVTSMGETGLPLAKLGPAVLNGILPLEGRLAKLGLRPTSDERSRRKTSVPLPLWGLLVIGGLKLAIGISRDMPVGFLIVALFATFITIVIMQSLVGHLSPTGQKLLDQLRGGRESSPDPSITSVALFGLAGATAYAGMPEIDASMMEEVQKMSSAHAGSGGCGGHGCGGSGCGGGGCGGCGGCGG